jgi:acetylornithine aminotransferase
MEAALKGVSGVTTIRNAGMMIGIELDRPCAELVKMALAEKLLINVTAENVVRLLPPLVMNEIEAKLLVEQLSALIKKFLA